ncbi:hypothetical protein [Dokdonella sp.]|uniref:GapS1 family protein n=1 Tax=Dokdonella sp. TaxID=2291710 RepID=UPI0037830757
MNANEQEVRGNALIDEARRRLAEISFRSTLHACLYFLRKEPNDDFGWYERRPFLVFLMIKWAAELWNPAKERRDGADEDFNFVEQRIWDAIGHLVRDRRPSIMLRRAAFQQFWYQRSFEIGAIPRQAMLFGRLMRDSDVMRAFVADVGIEPEDFVRQLARMASQTGQFLGIPALEQLRPEPSDRDAQDWPRMTQFLITTPQQLHERMLALARYNAPRAVELCEQTPLIRTPFITTHNGEECVHHQVLYQGISTVMYDILRERGAEAFMREFGPAFEEYISAVLQELPYDVIRETELEEILGGKGKCVDFAVVSDDALLLVDAKGIEGHYDERYHNLSEVLTEKLRTTAIHAVKQAIETITRLPHELKRPLTVFVCVTYKQLNIGDGDALRDLTHGTEEWNNARWLEPRLPSSNMFTVSVNEFELLCGVLRRGVSIADVFARVLQNNKNPQTSKFLFEQHMAHYGEVDIPTCSRLAAFELCNIA